mgnify:CR=1 FL=1
MNDGKSSTLRRVWPLWLAVGTLFLLLGHFGCGEGLGGWLVSNQDEVDIGNEVDQQIETDYVIVQDSDPAAQWARDLVAKLEISSGTFRDPAEFGGYKTEVISDEMINAFAGPGGFVYITTGLILNAETCAEIAGVMAHELGHVAAKHGVKNIEEAVGVQALAQWLLGGTGAGTVLETVYGVMMNTTFSREHEREADDLGVQIAYGAGYNPFGLVDFFEKLLAMEAESGGSYIPEFLSSHPANADRIRDVSNLIGQYYGGQVVRGQTQSYECLGTNMNLADVQAHILSGNLATR